MLVSGDLYEEQDILNWLLTQKDPSGDVIDEVEGESLLKTIQEAESLAVYFCEYNILHFSSLSFYNYPYQVDLVVVKLTVA